MSAKIVHRSLATQNTAAAEGTLPECRGVNGSRPHSARCLCGAAQTMFAAAAWAASAGLASWMRTSGARDDPPTGSQTNRKIAERSRSGLGSALLSTGWAGHSTCSTAERNTVFPSTRIWGTGRGPHGSAIHRCAAAGHECAATSIRYRPRLACRLFDRSSCTAQRST